MKLFPLLLVFAFALTGCDFGEDKVIEKISGGEPKRFFSVSSVTVAEGDTATFTVSFNRAHSQTMTVPYSTMNATALAGTDYTATSGTLTFAPGETSKSFTVATIDDAAVESSEYFIVAFGSGSGYETSASATSVTGVINDTDTPKTLHVFSATAAEGNSVQFTVNLSGASDYTVTVNYATNDGTATTADSDYTSTSGTLTFAPGETSKTISVPTGGDTHFEENETFGITLSGGANYTSSGSTLAATGTIVNDDSEPTVFFAAASAAEGSNVSFTVNLSNRSYETVTINYATSHGTAGASDYTPASGTLTFAPGDTSETVTVATTADLIFESDETFTLTLSGGANYTAAGSTLTGTGTVTNNDNQPTVAIDSVSVTEGGALAYTVTLSNPSSLTVTVNYATANGTATLADSDYTSASGTLTFTAGETTKTVNVNTTADTRFEADETLAVNLSGGSNYNSTGSTLSGTGTITNDDSAPTIAIDNVSANEGSTLSFTATLSSASSQTITVDYATSNGTATTGDSDYTAATGTLTFSAGETAKTITVNTTADIYYEANETLNVTLSGGSNYTSAGSTLAGIGTITNNDTKPTISVANASASEGSSVDFTVTLSHRTYESVTIDYASSNGTAGAADFTAATGTLVFAAGETSKTISVSSTADTVYEPNETFGLTLSGGSNYTAAGSTLTATGTINNDDSQPTVAIDSVSETEGSVLSFTVTLSSASSQTVTVNYATANGTALTTDSDYTAASGTLTFAAGETTKSVNVNSNSDNKFEGDEAFTVTLSGGSNYTSAGSTLTGTGTIANDDSAPTLAIDNVSANEGSALTFTVTLSSISTQIITVDYATSDGTATTGDSDYTSATGTLTFAAGDLTKTITVNTTADAYYEANETVNVTLSGGTNYTAAGSTLAGIGTITNNDTRPTISVGNASASEGSSVDFTVQLSHRSFETVTVDYATSHGTAGAADYSAATGTLVFAAGETSKTVSVTTTADSNLEANETFTLTLSGGGNYTSAGSTLTANGTITNDDSNPTISIADASATEGSAITFTVTLSALSNQTITVDYATSNGTATTGDSDYSSTTGTLTFAAGDSSKTITVNTTADTKFEVNETLSVTLSGGSNYTSAGSTLTATGTINNDDSAPTISIAAASATEGSNVDFTVTLSAASSQTVTVNYALTDGTATSADSDYTASSGTVTFAAGDTSETVSIATTADTKYEANETFTVTLSGGGNYTAAGSTLTATGTINNDDAVPTISIGSASGDEGGNITFTVTQDRQSSSATTFSYNSSSGTATSGSDFTATSGTGTISAGATTVTISVPAAEDADEETDETFTMTISSPSGATINTAAGTGTITDTAILMNFLAGSLPSGATFSRASSATYIDSSGTLVTATSGNPRFDYDPVGLGLRGLLIEPASTNLVTFSAAFDDASWTKNAIRAVSANSADAATPDGVNTSAELIRESGANSSHVVYQTLGTAVTAGSLVHFTVYAKDDTSNPRNFLRLKVTTGTNEIYANFDLTGGNSPTTGSAGNGGGQLSASAEDAGNGWKRLRVSGVATTSGTSLTAAIFLQDSFGGAETYSGDNASGVNLWGAQVEAGTSVATSYIPTGAATASRAAETLAVTGFTGFSGNYGDGTNFTMITDFSRPYFESTATTAYPQAATLCALASCSTNRISQSYVPASSEFSSNSWVSGTQQGESISNGITPAAHTVYQLGTVKTGTSLRTFLNGTGHTASGALSYPTADALYLAGGASAGQISGHLRKFTFRARAVPNAQVQSLTSD
jgi:hypothetical protein